MARFFPNIRSVHLSFCLSIQTFLWNWIVSFFNFFGMLETVCENFLKKKKKRKSPEDGENRFLNLLKNLVISYFLIWSILKVDSACYIPHKSHTWKPRGSEILAKVLSVNQITGVLNQHYFLNKMMRQPYFFFAYTNS